MTWELKEQLILLDTKYDVFCELYKDELNPSGKISFLRLAMIINVQKVLESAKDFPQLKYQSYKWQFHRHASANVIRRID